MPPNVPNSFVRSLQMAGRRVSRLARFRVGHCDACRFLGVVLLTGPWEPGYLELCWFCRLLIDRNDGQSPFPLRHRPRGRWGFLRALWLYLVAAEVVMVAAIHLFL